MECRQGVKFVRGFVAGVDKLPKVADRHGFRTRIAFVIDSFREGAADAVFDADVYIAMISAVAEAVDACEFRIGAQSVSSISEVADQMASVPREDREPFETVFLSNLEKPQAIVFSEPWVRVGGPDPYHDAYVAAVLTDSDSVERVEKCARQKCEQVGVEVVETIIAQEAPTTPRRSLMGALIRILRK